MNKNERLKQLCHLIVGASMMPLAFKLFEKNNFKLSILFLVVGILFSILAAAYESLENRYGSIVKLFFLLESAVWGFAAVAQLWIHKKTLFIAYCIAGFIYFLLFLYFLYENDKKKKKKRRKRSSSSKYSTSL